MRVRRKVEDLLGWQDALHSSARSRAHTHTHTTKIGIQITNEWTQLRTNCDDYSMADMIISRSGREVHEDKHGWSNSLVG